MSVHGLKPAFNDFQGYKSWRKTWKETYKDVSSRIRAAKENMAWLNGQQKSGHEMTKAWEHLKGATAMANKLMSVLDVAKLRMNNITTMKKGMEAHAAQFPLEIRDCPMIDFHFNKKHLEFPWIPMWVVKTKGQTFYVHHVDANAPWTTRETPDHTSTKGSLRFRKCHLSISGEGVATITAAKVEAPVEAVSE